MAALLEIKDLSVEIMSTRGLIHAANEVNLTLETGRVHGVVGESGCGKSVTAKAIIGLHDSRLTRIRGQILLEGRDLLAVPESEMESIRGRSIGMIFQDPVTALDPLFRIGDQIAEVYTRHFNDTKQQARSKTLTLLERVGILPAESRYNQYPFEFSGGMLQRVVIAMAIAAGPKLLIADEPTTALDVTIQAQILDLLGELRRDLDLTTLIITHNFSIVSEMCDDVSVMYAGTIVETGTKTAVLSSPLNRYSRALIASIPRAGMQGQRLVTIPGVPPELFDRLPGCPFAPRCADAVDDCRIIPRQLTPVGGGSDSKHMAACRFAEGRE